MLGVGRSGNIHYVKAQSYRPMTACNSGAADFIELVYHGQLVTCGNCCSIAKHNRHKIKMREVKPVIRDQSHTSFIRRHQQRVLAGNAWSGRHRIK